MGEEWNHLAILSYELNVQSVQNKAIY